MNRPPDRLPPLTFVIHDLHPWGGQDRSTLEIAEILARTQSVRAVSYRFDPLGPGSPAIPWTPVTPRINRPAVAKILYFHGRTFRPLRLLRKIDPDSIIHSTGTSSLIADVIQIQFLHHAWRETLHKIPALRSRNRAQRLYDRTLLEMNCLFETALYSKEKHYIAIARTVKNDLERFFPVQGKIHVVHHGVDSASFHPPEGAEVAARIDLREKLGIPADRIVLLLVGAYERKGLETILHAAARLPSDCRSRIHILAVGSGNKDYFRTVANQQGIGSQATFIGHGKNPLSYYQAADIFFLPTLYEPFGMVITEAMACGLPLLVSECAGAAELTEHGQSSFLLKQPSDADEAATHLQTLIRHPELRKTIAERGLSIARSRPWEKVASEYADVFRTVALERGQKRGRIRP